MRIFVVSASIIFLAGLVFGVLPYDAGIEQIGINYPERVPAPEKILNRWGIENPIAAKIDPLTDAVRLLVAKPIPTGIIPTNDESAVRCAEQFIRDHADMLGVSPQELSLEGVNYIRIRDFWSVSFKQVEGNLPVWGNHVVMAVNRRGEIFYLTSSIKPLKSVSLTENISRQEAVAIAIDRIKPVDYEIRRAEKIVCALPEDDGYNGVAAWWIQVRTTSPTGFWRVFVDAGTGEILTLANELRTFTGNISGHYLPHYYDDSPEIGGFPYEYLIVDGASAYTDSEGNFTIPTVGEIHDFYTTLSGEYCKIRDYLSEVGEVAETLEEETYNFVWTTPRFPIEQLNLYYHVNWIHSWVKYYLGFDRMDYQMRVYCNDTIMEDNAAYAGGNLYFSDEGTYLHEPSLFAEIIYHEYTHGVTHHIYSDSDLPYIDQSGAIDEALSDYFPCSIFDDPYMGERSLVGSSSSYMRNLENSKRYPEDFRGEVHHDSQIISGAWWEIRTDLGAGYTDSLVHWSRFLYPATFEDYLYAMLSIDDDDGNLDNGTPNAAVIFTAYSNHGIGPGNLLTVYHIPLHSTDDTINPYPVRVEITTLFGIDSATVYYRSIYPGSTPVWNPVELSNVSGSVWEGEIPPQPMGSVVQYYIRVKDVIGNTMTLPDAGPSGPYGFRVAEDDVPPEVEHIPLQYVGIAAWSPKVVAFAHDDFGISEVNLEYQINDSPVYTVSMEYDSALDAWVGRFDRNVHIGDVVRYRIVAADASCSHNTSSFPAEDSWVEFEVQRDYYDDIETGGYDFTHYSFTDGYSDMWHRSSQKHHSGEYSFKCGSSTVGATYANKLDACLELPEIFVSPGDTFSFYHSMSAETSSTFSGYAWDGGIVEISTDDGVHWRQISPVEGYPFRIRENPDSPFDPETPCFSGLRNWEQVHFVMRDSGYVKIRLRFGSDAAVTMDGWYVDDFRMTNLHWASVFDGKNWKPEKLSVVASPNPFNGTVLIETAVPQETKLSVSILDLNGRVITTIFDGTARPGVMRLRWDAAQLPSGVYFAVVQTPSSRAATKLLYVK